MAGLVPKFTVAPVTNPVPVRVNVKAAPPTVTEVGAREVRVGAEAVLIVNDTEPDVPPPGAGFVTVTGAVPAVAISAAVMAAANCVALTNVVVLVAPLNFTSDVDTKPVPFTVRVKAAPPAVALVGEREVSVGAGLLMAKVWAFDVPPPAGFVTVTFTVPAEAISAAGIVATIWVLVTDEGVIAGLDPKFTIAPLIKPVPFTVKVKAGPPDAALDGDIVETVGRLVLSKPYTSTAVEVPT